MSKNYWQHRISYEVATSYPLLEEKNILSIGFSDFSEKEFVKQCTGNLGALNQWFEKKWGKCSRIRHNLLHFLNMKKGDYVVVPHWGGVFSVYEVESDDALIAEELESYITNLKNWDEDDIVLKNGLLYVKDTKIDLGFFRKVASIITNASRSEYADAALTSRMKYRGTNIKSTDLKENIEKAIEGLKDKNPINLHSNILEKTLEETHSLISKNLNPEKFEKLIEWYFKKAGATQVEKPSPKETEEGDADVTATFESIKTIIYVQVKFHNKESETNEWAIEQIENYAQEKGDSEGYSTALWVISNAENFSEQAQNKARESNVMLINGKKFTEMILQIGISELTL